MHADPEIRALTWRCRRGMRELDQLLLGFLNQHFETLETPEKQAFLRLLDMQDPEIFGFLVRGITPEDHGIAAIVHTVLNRTDTSAVHT
ncbi:MAG: succinate dehydrogenase assembly factor 2 [Pseudomonadota bacterium]